MRSIFLWITQHRIFYATGCVLLMILLLAMQVVSIDSSAGKRFVLIPYPSWNPSHWVASFSLLYVTFPLMALAVYVVPLSALLIGVFAWYTTRAVAPSV